MPSNSVIMLSVDKKKIGSKHVNWSFKYSNGPFAYPELAPGEQIGCKRLTNSYSQQWQCNSINCPNSRFIDGIWTIFAFRWVLVAEKSSMHPLIIVEIPVKTTANAT